MKTYDDDHWMAQRAINGDTTFDVMGAVAQDLEEGNSVLTELFAYYLSGGTDEKTRDGVQAILTDIFKTDPNEGEDKDKKYMRAQARSMYALALASQDLNRFCDEATGHMVEDINERGADSD
jgi:hypothetical protein